VGNQNRFPHTKLPSRVPLQGINQDLNEILTTRP
jgi:hypothetical protein